MDDPEIETMQLSRRLRMVDDQLFRRGIRDSRVLAAMRSIPRHRFMPAAEQPFAYDDSPRQIGHGQTISQPYIVALMTELLELERHHRVLEVGTGSGYQTAVLAEIAEQVYSIELLPQLLSQANDRLYHAGYRNVTTMLNDGSAGWEARSPFDRILVTAAAEELPEPLLAQLGAGGILVAPVGSPRYQELLRIRQTPDGLQQSSHGRVTFVPLRPGRPPLR